MAQHGQLLSDVGDTSPTIGDAPPSARVWGSERGRVLGLHVIASRIRDRRWAARLPGVAYTTKPPP